MIRSIGKPNAFSDASTICFLTSRVASVGKVLSRLAAWSTRLCAVWSIPAALKTPAKSIFPSTAVGRFPGSVNSGGSSAPSSLAYLAIKSSVDFGGEGSSFTTNHPSTVDLKPFFSFIGGARYENQPEESTKPRPLNEHRSTLERLSAPGTDLGP